VAEMALAPWVGFVVVVKAAAATVAVRAVASEVEKTVVV